jgi:hypothetical protein
VGFGRCEAGPYAVIPNISQAKRSGLSVDKPPAFGVKGDHSSFVTGLGDTVRLNMEGTAVSHGQRQLNRVPGG